MANLLGRYMHWLHTRWPAGTVEKLPEVREDGTCNVPGVRIVGDLTGIPLLKFSLDTGAKAAKAVAGELEGSSGGEGVVDLAIVGGGVAGMAAAVEARRLGLSFVVIEATEPFFTIVNFPARKPIFTYPTEMQPDSSLQVRAEVKEALLEELHGQVREAGIETQRARAERIVRGEGGKLRVELADGGPVLARRVIVAIGRSGDYRQLGVPGEDRENVYHRLHDPADFGGRRVLMVGGGDSALEAAAALADARAEVTLSYRRGEFGRAKPENVERVMAMARASTGEGRESVIKDIEHPTDSFSMTSSGRFMRDNGERARGGSSAKGSLTLALKSTVKRVDEGSVVLEREGKEEVLANDEVFAMIGREAPLEFFRRSGINLRGEWRAAQVVSLILILAFAVWMYHWKKTGVVIAGFWPFNWISEIGDGWAARGLFPYNVPEWWASLGGAFNDPANLLGTLKISLGEPGFYYSLAYCTAVVCFGIARIRRRRTPYIAWQTTTLALIQCVPLFLMPYILLPWMGNNGIFDSGILNSIANSLFPEAGYGHGREYWRAFGLILAWPLFIWNIFTDQPLWGWLVISLVQTFIIIPGIVFLWGKGAYCGWICSCGALAETVGDQQRHKMPHGPFWNRFNMIGQTFLLFAFLLLVIRIVGWTLGSGSGPSRAFHYLMYDLPFFNYVWFVDLLWAGIFGVAFYFHFSGRVWCRFACPLAALMHIYARFSRFRIFSEKKKCISCNVCTSVCHQGIDVMSFANKGLGMNDPQCVRCSACVQSCPTGVLRFGRVDRDCKPGHYDRLPASPVQMREQKES